jgi:hypothetical protein
MRVVGVRLVVGGFCGAVVTGWALAGPSVPSASAQPCPDVEVVFARGTGDPPNVPILHWPKPRAKRTDDDTPVHSFTSLLANLATICAKPDSAGRQHASVHHHHPLHPAATPSLRTTRRLTPPRLRVVTNPHQTNHKTRANTQQRQPNRRNFGLAGIDTVVAEPGGAVEQHLGLLPLLRRVAVEPPVGGPLVQRSPNGDRRGQP